MMGFTVYGSYYCLNDEIYGGCRISAVKMLKSGMVCGRSELLYKVVRNANSVWVA